MLVEAPKTAYSLAEQLFSGVSQTNPVDSSQFERQFKAVYTHDYGTYLSVPIHARLEIRAKKHAANPERTYLPNSTQQDKDNQNWCAAASDEERILLQLITRYTVFTETFKLADGRTIKELSAEDMDALCQERVVPQIRIGPAANENYFG